MSWFTTTKGYMPVCCRCHTADHAVLVKHSGEYTIYDCRKCGPVPPREAAK